MKKYLFIISLPSLLFFFTSCQRETDMCQIKQLISKQQVLFNKPPSEIPVAYSTDAPMLGNGYTGVALSGNPEKQVYYFARNDFWRLKSSFNQSFPAVLGKLEINIPELKGSSYHVKQDLYNAITLSRFSNHGMEVNFKSFISADEDLMIIEISLTGDKILQGDLMLALPGREELSNYSAPFDLIHPVDTAHGKTKKGIYYISRAFLENVDIQTKAACAFRVLNNETNQFTLREGKPVTIALAFSSNFKSGDCLQTVISRLQKLNPGEIPSIESGHKQWWENYWSESWVEIHDSLIERQYYLSNYNMACFSRDKDFPPGLFGTCITAELPYWAGDYHLNYNHFAPFYGLFSSNHIEQAIPCNLPLLAFMERGEYYSEKVCGIPGGILLPVGIGPLGIETVRKNDLIENHFSEWIEQGNIEDEGMFWGQKSNSAYAVVNMANHFYTTYDEEYTRLYYPFVKGVATFWENYLVFENGRYIIYNDAIHEGSIGNINPILSLGLVSLTLQTAIDMSRELKIDKERLDKWQHIIDHLSGYSFQKKNGKKVFRYTEWGADWWDSNTLGIQHIYPAGQIGLNSDPELLQVACNTIDVMQRWIDHNGSNSFFPAAVRVGYDSQKIIKHLHDYINNTRPNGFQQKNPHGIENLSTVPNTINEMLCMGHGGILRVFPVWPKDRDARFSTLRKEGAFLVSSEIEKGKVLFIEILSEKGKTCILKNPWHDGEVILKRSTGKKEHLKGEFLEINTYAGENIMITPESE